MTATELYARRFRRVLEHIDGHLDADLTVEHLSQVASSSKFHFHRQFSELYGISVFKYVQLMRLRRASFQLAFRSWESVTDVALASGYESLEAFTRAFKKNVGRTPSEFRAEPEWRSFEAYRPVLELRSQHMQPNHRPEDVKIVQFEATRVAAFEHHGDPAGLGASIRTFIAWRKENNLPPSVSATFNVFFGPPDDDAPETLHVDLCAATTRPIAENRLGVVEKTIPAGRCAVLRHVGSDDGLESSIHFLYSTWLPASGEEPRDYPLFIQRVHFFPEVPENEQILDIFLPVR